MSQEIPDVIVLKSGYFIEGIGLVPRVKGLYRDHTPGRFRWVVKPNNDNGGVYSVFYDRAHGNSSAKSYKEAMKFLYSHSELLSPGTRRVLHERATKKIKMGEPGIHMSISHRGNLDYYTVIVGRMAEVPAVGFYAGNDNTKDKYMKQAVELARVERGITVRKYRRKRKVKLSDAMPWKVEGL